MKNTNYLKEELYELIKTHESIFDFIQESSLDGLWYWDLEHPEEEWMNPKFWSVLGYDHQEMPHKASAWQDIIHPEDLKLATENFIKHCENPHYPYDQTVRYTHKNGSTVWIRCRGLAIRDKQGKPLRMLGAHQEITAIKNSELLLQKNISLLRNAQQVSQTGSWELDLKTNEVAWTEELSKMYGFDPTLPPPPYPEHKKQFTPESWEALTSAIALTEKQGIPYELELKTIRADESNGWMWVRGEAVFDENKNIIGLRGVAQDITEKKNLELEKETLFKRLNYALDASGDGIWDRTPDGKTVYSKAWLEMLGYEVGELASLTSEWSDRLHPNDVEWVFAAINKVSHSPENGDTINHEYRFRNKAGDYLWILNKAKVVERNAKGEASRVVGTHTNITERKKVQDDLQVSESRMRGIIDSDTLFIVRLDLQGYYTYANKSFVEHFGHVHNSADSYIGQWALDSIYKDDRQSMHEGIEKLFVNPSEVISVEARKPLPNGELIDTLWNVSCVTDTKGIPSEVQCIGFDISERKKAEEAIKQTTLLLEEVQSQAKMGTWELDLTTGKTFWTDEVYRIHEVEKDFDHNKEVGIGFYHPDHRHIISKAFTDSIEQQIPFDVKCKFITAKNNQLCVRSTGYPVIKEGKLTHIIGLIEDITQTEADKETIFQQQMFSEQLLKNMADGFGVVDVEGRQTVVNKAFCEMTQFSENELIGQTAPFPYWPAEELENIGKAFQQTMAGDLSTFELTFQKKNGERFPVQLSTGILKDEYDNTINYFANIKDITAIKKENQHLKLLESVITNTKDSVLITEADHFDEPGPKIIYVNEAFTKMTGYTAEEVIGKTPRILQGPNSDREELAKLSKAIRKWEPCEITTINYKKSGEEFWINFSVTPVADEKGWYTHWIAIERDITEQKKSEQALKDSELRFSVAIEGTEAGIWDWDILNNKAIFSTQWKDMLGYVDAEIENSFEGWKKLWHPDDTSFIEKAVSDHLNGVSKKYEVIHRCLHKDGGWRWIMTRGKILRNSEDKPYRWVGTSVNITAQKQAEENQKIAKEQAEAANKAKSEFLANMSHEIRTPLNGVIGFTELLTKTPLSPVQQQYANSANVSGHTLLGIINDILDFSKIEAGMLELEMIKTDMVALLENSIDIVIFSAADREFELLLDIDPAMPRFAQVDAIRTQQILANLLSNAVNFTKKGEVALKVVYQALDDKQGKLSISVRDTGIGITEEQKAKLFKSFSQADSSTTRKFGGTGLGLVISQMIAEKMGSKINIDSTPDVGSTFFFDIITHFEEAEKLDTTEIIGVKRCLIIDDNNNNRLILEQMLKHWQIESDSCSNGFEALQKLENSQPYDVIICDYDMPYFNGIETIRLMKDKLKLSTEKQPVILLHSSIDNAELNQKSKQLGIRFRLNKPVKSQDLFNYLSNLDQTAETIPQKETEQTVKLSHTSEKIKILIAEDNPLNMVLSKTMLSHLMPNSEVYEARNGLEAIEQYKSISLDLIFMDIQMPELDGIEATKKIRALEVNKSNHLPIVALTAGALKEEKEKCLAAGMDDFLTKPLEYSKIQTVLNKFFQQGKKTDADLENIDANNEIHFGFSELKRSSGNDLEMAQILITILITDLPAMIDQLEQACEAIDLANIKTIAHSIKGSALSMRCNVLADIAGKMEKAAENNSFDNFEVPLIELKEEWETVKNLLLQKIDH